MRETHPTNFRMSSCLELLRAGRTSIHKNTNNLETNGSNSSMYRFLDYANQMTSRSKAGLFEPIERVRVYYLRYFQK